MFLYEFYLRCCGVQGVSNNNRLKLGMIFPKGWDESLGGILFTVVLGGTIGIVNGFRCQGYDFFVIRVNDTGTKELMDIVGGAEALK